MWVSVIGPPTGTDPFAPEIKPSVLWYWIGGLLLVAGVIGGVVWGVVGFSRMMDQIEDFQRVHVPGSGEVFIDDPGGYTIYHEYEGAATSSWRQAPDVEITDPSGSPVFVESYGPNASLTYDYEHEGVAVYTFDAPTTGTYEVETHGELDLGWDQQIAIGRSFTGTLAAAILGALAIGAIGVLSGTILLIVTAVRRGSAKRKSAAAAWVGAPGVAGAQYGFPPPPPNQYPPPPGQYPPPAGQYPPPPGQYPPPPPAPGTWPAPSAGSWPPPAPPGSSGLEQDALSSASTEDGSVAEDWTPPIP